MFDEIQFDSIVATHNRELRQYCLDRLSHDFGSAEEVTNDVFILLYKKWGTLDFTEVRAWLFRTADNIILHYRRKKNRINETLIYDFIDKNLPEELITIDWEDGVVSDEYVSSILSKLDEDELELYRYRYVEEMSFAKISEVSGIPKSTVISKVNRIKSKLTKYIQDEGEDDVYKLFTKKADHFDDQMELLYEVMGVGRTKLEEKLLEIEKKKPFQNDEDMLRAVEKILLKERRKRDSKQDFELINECVETSLMLKGYDIDKLNRYIESTQQETLDILHGRIRLEQTKAKPRAHIIPKRYRPAFIIICVVVGLILASVTGYAMGFDPLKHIINDLFNIPVGESISEGDHEYIRVGEPEYFDTVDELLQKHQLTILYPYYLPQGISLNKIGVSTISNNNSTFTFEFSSDALMYIIDTYEVFDYSTLEGQLPTYEANDITYYILDEQSRYTVYFESQNIQYMLQYNDYDELIKIIDSMEEYK